MRSLILTLFAVLLLSSTTLWAQTDPVDNDEQSRYEFARMYLMNTQYFASNDIEEGTIIYSNGNYVDLAGQTIGEAMRMMSVDGWQMVNATRGGGDSYRAEFIYFQRKLTDN